MREGHIRRPGEAAFAFLLLGASVLLLIKAYDIDGFSALSSAGAVPMGAGAAMVASAAIIAWKTFKSDQDKSEKFWADILPRDVWIGIAAIVAYAFLLVPVGFLPTSFLFLAVMTKLLSGRSMFFAAWTSAVSVLAIYVVFRVVFLVLMPEGVVPEGRILSAIASMFGGK